MKNIFWSFKKMFLITITSSGFIFWCIAYPVILMSLFYLAFMGITTTELQEINIGYDNNRYIEFFSKEIDFINTEKMDLEKGKERLLLGELTSFVEDDFTILNVKSGPEQTAVKNIFEIAKRMETLAILGENLDQADFDTDYVNSINQISQPLNIIYFSLIAMVSLYGYYGAIEIVNLVFPNRSATGQRVGVSPVNKINFLNAAILENIIINMLGNLILLLYMKFILKMDLITDPIKTLYIIFCGNIFGTGLGLLIGLISSISDDVKTGIGIALTLFLSFLSGMMNPNVKLFLDEKIPIINKLNPISLITDNLYRINMLNMNKTLLADSLKVLAVGLVFIAISGLYIRRQSYDSL
ncbi:MAG: ABC transporter permease [Tissierellia bacterium]|nr:ABC transporter permease [Tissierellia bacterium]